MKKCEARVVCITKDRLSPFARFILEIDLGAGLTQREQTILLNSPRSCEVSKLLAGNIKEIDSVKDRVSCLKWELGHIPSLSTIKQVVKQGVYPSGLAHLPHQRNHPADCQT